MYLYLFHSPLEAWEDLNSFISSTQVNLITHMLSIILNYLFRGTSSSSEHFNRGGWSRDDGVNVRHNTKPSDTMPAALGMQMDF